MMIIRVGIVQFFFLHTPLLANQNATHVGTSYMVRRSSAQILIEKWNSSIMIILYLNQHKVLYSCLCPG